jgi:hypothetical protein
MTLGWRAAVRARSPTQQRAAALSARALLHAVLDGFSVETAVSL